MIKLMLSFVSLFFTLLSAAQTSWKGTVSTDWATSANWTTGVPSSSIEVIIGDNNFTGSFQPNIESNANCKSLSIGGGTKSSTLNITKNLTVLGNITLASNGSITHTRGNLSFTGNWSNSGNYSFSGNAPSVVLSGSVQLIAGSSLTTFNKITINNSSTVTVTTNTNFSSATVNGTVNPYATIGFKAVTGGSLSVFATGTLKVNGASYLDNYSSASISAGSTINYSATGNQTIAAFTYSTLRISGSGVKSLIGNLNNFNSASSSSGNIYIDAGTLDLLSFTANRGTSTIGGTLNVANNATLRLSGSNFPTGFATNSFNLTSTVDYYGSGTQPVTSLSYGNLILSSSSGAATKTLPGTTFTVSGNFTSSASSGTLGFTAASNISFNGNCSIGSSTTFNGGAYTQIFGDNLVNQGIFNGATGTVNMNGSSTTISGSGTYNFNNLTISSSSVAATSSSLSISGNLSTSGSGTFTHSSGTITMSGSDKSISGTSIILDNLTITGSVSNAGFDLKGNMNMNGSLSSTGGTIKMSGINKDITGSSAPIFNVLSITGIIGCNTNFAINHTLDVSGSFAATSGTCTFTGSSLFNGTANLFNLAINGTSLQLAANATLGIANNLTVTSGILNTTTTVPNTINYNGTGSQNIAGLNYNNLVLSNGNVKTAMAAFTVNSDFTILENTIFNASSYNHLINGNWNNNGSFNAGSSTITFNGALDATITGTTVFNVLTINKSNATNSVFLQNNITAPTVNMTQGYLRTKTSKITITGNRTGEAVILGTIERNHVFNAGTNYAFSTDNNFINFTSPSGINSVTVTASVGNVGDFPFGSAINRQYIISILSGSYASATFRFYYEDGELNGNSESSMQFWSNAGSSWSPRSKTTNNISTNYVELSGITDLAARWTLSDDKNVVRWTGATSSDWFTETNWEVNEGNPSRPPSVNDVVEFGTVSFVHHPVINNNAAVRSIVFGNVQPATLTIATGGTLTTEGNISGIWSGPATHSIVVGSQTLTIRGDLTLSDGTTGNAINLFIGIGVVNINGTLTQSGGANISFNSTGTLNISGDFIHNSGTFSAGSGRVVFNGNNFQSVAGVIYNELTINKAAGIATSASTNTIINGNLTINSGEFDFFGPTTVNGNVIIGIGAFAKNSTTIIIGGNWINNGTFIPNGGLATFNGSGNQSISSTNFNKLIFNKPSGIAYLTGNLNINNDINVLSGTLNLSNYTINRSTIGGVFSVANGASLWISGTNNFPSNYSAYAFGTNSNTFYDGTVSQSVAGITYGHLTFSNSSTKTLAASATLQGDVTISSGAIFNGDNYNLFLSGNWINNGTFVPATGLVQLNGIGKTITGATTFNKVTVTGDYDVMGNIDLQFNDALQVVENGKFSAGNSTSILHGDLINRGTLISNGITTFAGTRIQKISLINAISSLSTGVINFNGTVAPILNSTSSPQFYTININNTAGITPSVDWMALSAFNIGIGAKFHGGDYTHTFYGNFTNNGTVTSNGTLLYLASNAPRTVALGSNTFTSTGNVVLGGNTALTVSGTPAGFNHVTISNTNNVTPGSGWTVNGNLTINNYAVINAGSNSFLIGGDIYSNGTLNEGTSTFTFKGDSVLIAGSANTTFYDLVIAATVIEMQVVSSFNISHNLTNNNNTANNAAIEASSASIIFTGNTPSIISGAANSFQLAQMIVNKSGSNVTLAKNITAANNIQVKGGTFDLSTYTLTQDASVGVTNTLSIADNATLKIGGTSSLPLFTTYIIDTLSTVEYAGTTQTIANTVTYGNLVVSAGTKSINSGITIAKNFTLSGGTITGGSYTHNVKGNWIMTGGTFTNSGTTIHLNGILPQTINSTGAFNNLTINNASGISLSSAVTVNGTISFANGKISAGDYNLTANGSVSGTDAMKYVVATGVGSLIQPVVTNAAKTYPVGTATYYLPAIVIYNLGSNDNVGVRIVPAAYVNGESGTLKTTNAVNATWNVTRAGAGAISATLTFQWPEILELTGFNRSISHVAHYTNGTWDFGTSSFAATGTNPYTATRSGFTSFSPFSIQNTESVLNVSWLSISGKRKGNDNHITWSTATETDNRYFEVLGSATASNFETIGTVQGGINTSSVQHYEFVHKNVTAPVMYYRIKQIDIDGRYTLSGIIKITNKNVGNAISIRPNPVKNVASVSFASSLIPGHLTITNAAGHVLEKRIIQPGTSVQTIMVNMSDKAAGLYFIQITDALGRNQIARLIKE